MRPGSAGVSTEASGASAFTLRTYPRPRAPGPPVSGARPIGRPSAQASAGESCGPNSVTWVIQGAL